MDTDPFKKIDDQIERANTGSKQPRFSEVSPEGFFTDMMRLGMQMEEKAPDWLPDTRRRDQWLIQFAKSEPHLQGVLHSMISIDSNRGWDLVGGRNQTLRYADILHGWKHSPGLKGWRPGCAGMASGFYNCDIGGIGEFSRQGKKGPIRGIFHVDPSCCRMTGDEEFPLKYQAKVGKDKTVQPWRELDYMRVVSMPDLQENYNGVGFCFVSRTMMLVQIMVAVWQYDKEELGARAPRGLLLLLGISQQQWENAMKARDIKMDGEGWTYYNAVAVLASMGANIDAKLVALSQLPKGFDLQNWINIYMYGMALCAGYDPSEFYPVQFGSLGRGTEMEVQHEKATAKGQKNFSLTLQEQLQRPDVLPPTLHFEIQERDEAAEVQMANSQKAWIDNFKTMRETGLVQDGVGGISNQELRQLYAEHNLIPEEWTVMPEDTSMSDEDTEERKRKIHDDRQIKRTRDELLSMTSVYRAALKFPTEPIVRHHDPGYGKAATTKILWDTGEDLLYRQTYPSVKRMKTRKDNSEVLYNQGGVLITQDMVDQAIKEGTDRVGEEFGQILNNEPVKE